MMLWALTLTVTSSFPLPTVDGKTIAVTPHQKEFRVPLRYEKIKAFYVEQLSHRPGINVTETRVAGRRVLSITNTQRDEGWTKARVLEGDIDTRIELTPVIRLDEEDIAGTGKPLIQFYFGRSPEVERAVNSIDHTEGARAK
jgi:hypothetical protein